MKNGSLRKLVISGIKKVDIFNIRRIVNILKLINIMISIEDVLCRIVRRVRKERKAKIINRITIITGENREGLRRE